MGYLSEIGIVLLLLVINGWFSMSELAIVSSRRPRLEAMALDGNVGAETALRLASQPARFLSSAQIGITLVGIFAGAFSGATLADPLGRQLEALGISASAANALSIALVVGSITYLSLIIGELVPKQIALADPERVASMVARPMAVLVVLTTPIAIVLELSSRLLLALLRIHPSANRTVTEEEIRAVIAEGTSSGILEPEEKELMAGVMRFGDRSIRAVMIPRPEIAGLDLEWDEAKVAETLAASSHSRYPVYAGSIDTVQGVVQAKDLLAASLSGAPFAVSDHIRPVDMVPDTASALDVLETLRKSPLQMVMVIDEYGTVEGLVTAADILAAIAGNFATQDGEAASAIFRREDGSWLIDADLDVGFVADKIGCRALDDPERDYETLAGFVLAVTKAIPATGDVIDWNGWHFEVIDMDGRRIDKVLVTAPPATASP